MVYCRSHSRQSPAGSCEDRENGSGNFRLRVHSSVVWPNSSDCCKSVIQLTIQRVLTFTPSAFTEGLHDVAVKSGQHLRLRCLLSTLPTYPYVVTWTKNDECIENDDNITIITDGCALSLDFFSTETTDTGHYKCIVSCKSRRITCSAYLTVIGKLETCLSS